MRNNLKKWEDEIQRQENELKNVCFLQSFSFFTHNLIIRDYKPQLLHDCWLPLA